MHVGRVHVATNHGLQLAGRGLDLGHGQNKLRGFIIIILVNKRELLTATTWAGGLDIIHIFFFTPSAKNLHVLNCRVPFRLGCSAMQKNRLEGSLRFLFKSIKMDSFLSRFIHNLTGFFRLCNNLRVSFGFVITHHGFLLGS